MRRARARGARVLLARAAGAETQLAFAGLSDLLEGVDSSELAALPAPQLRALEVALLRLAPAASPPEPRAIAAGLLGALRALAARRPLLVAIDDVQWLDARSAEALAFAARRLDGTAPRFLLTRRSGDPTELEEAFGRDRLARVRLDPLSVGAVRRLLFERLGLTLTRRVLRTVAESTRGNPLFVLELGRALVKRGVPAIGEELALPTAVEEAFGERVAALPPELRRLLLGVALSPDLRLARLDGVAAVDVVDAAVRSGLVVLDGDRVRPSHPLLAAAMRAAASGRERAELHLALARAAPDDVRRAYHRAVAAETPDERLAAEVAAAADVAGARGAAETAAELAGHALRLTAEGTEQHTHRLLALADKLVVAGDEARLAALLSPVADTLPTPAARARAHLALAEVGADHQETSNAHVERALEESGSDPSLRALVLARKAWDAALAEVGRIPEAEAWANESLVAGAGAVDVERIALAALGWLRGLGGGPFEDLRKRAPATMPVFRSVDRAEAVALVWRGELDESRGRLRALLARADEHGEWKGYLACRLHLCELALRAGAWLEAERMLDEWGESSDRELILQPAYERCRGLVAAGRGDPEEAERWAAAALLRADETSARWEWLEGSRVRGAAALLAHDPERAAESLRRVWAHAGREGIHNPGAFPVAPDLVEALIDVDDLDAGADVTETLARRGEEQRHPWARASAKRCRGLLALAGGGDGDELLASSGDYDRLGLRFDAARALLALGRGARRRKKWGTARAALERAADAFDALESPGWADEARSELARVGGRKRRAGDSLTPAEERVAELAAAGLSNKEIASRLVVTVHTVEVHLSRAYAKLGVRSRAQLAAARKE